MSDMACLRVFLVELPHNLKAEVIDHIIDWGRRQDETIIYFMRADWCVTEKIHVTSPLPPVLGTALRRRSKTQFHIHNVVDQTLIMRASWCVTVKINSCYPSSALLWNFSNVRWDACCRRMER